MDGPPFVQADSFQGKRPGYVFKLGDSGLGYYFDPISAGTGGGSGGAGPYNRFPSDGTYFAKIMQLLATRGRVFVVGLCVVGSPSCSFAVYCVIAPVVISFFWASASSTSPTGSAVGTRS